MLLVENEDNYIYLVEKKDFIENNLIDGYVVYNLYLICGRDYVAPDYNNTMGYVTPDAFVDDIQFDTLLQYLGDESLKDVLAENGYTVVEHEPSIHVFNQPDEYVTAKDVVLNYI